jgi:hypothetical protein
MMSKPTARQGAKETCGRQDRALQYQCFEPLERQKRSQVPVAEAKRWLWMPPRLRRLLSRFVASGLEPVTAAIPFAHCARTVSGFQRGVREPGPLPSLAGGCPHSEIRFDAAHSTVGCGHAPPTFPATTPKTPAPSGRTNHLSQGLKTADVATWFDPTRTLRSNFAGQTNLPPTPSTLHSPNHCLGRDGCWIARGIPRKRLAIDNTHYVFTGREQAARGEESGKRARRNLLRSFSDFRAPPSPG